ncbi:Ca2+-binding protein, RTX toxin-related [Paracoccus alcaliphilus]|uniref:Ca2+-binding protein, RTX toxin-related n=1 Tax=Paracoccus alcaliphilus TaxID=34002 RepID=A0A1H8HRH7_9RHOB|nr:calcium-binding protein [Paracoccus alcaliphilus]SEN58772.1 Ca2+-binding protein, RTX toxin-related [Paracoccus alcaliphilus]
MISYRLVATYGSAPARWISNITDLTAVQVGERVFLTVATQPGGGLTSLSLAAPDQPLQLVANLAYPSGWAYRGTPRTSVLVMGGASHLYQTGLAGGEAFTTPLTGNGALGPFASRFDAQQLGTRLTDLGHFSTTAGDFVFSARTGEATLLVRKLLPGGQLGIAGSQTLSGPLVSDGASLDRIIAVDVGRQKILVAISGLGNFVSTHLVGNDGRLGTGALHSAAVGTGFHTPTAIEAVQFGGKTFLVMAAQGSSSLSVFQLSANGALTARDHIIDELLTRFQSVTALATAVVDGRAFVFAGGRDDGISVFTIQPDGRLLHLTSIADTDAMALANVTAIEAQVMDGRIMLFVASGTEAGVTQLLFDPGPIGFTGVAASGAPTGTSGNDLMLSRPGTTWMGGGEGDDILIATTESIALVGGPGADIFVAANIKGRIAVRDFEPGTDRLDLSQLGMIRSIWQLTFAPQSYGIKIFYNEAVIDVFSRDGRTLGPADFGNDIFPVAHYNLPPLNPAKIKPADTPSTIGRYHFGGRGEDVIRGGAGSDFIAGGPGNDRLFGLAGNDTIRGDAGHDMLRGHQGDDLLLGGPGRDTLFGDAGRDTLRGGAGPDLLYGGAGHDLLLGEGGHDRLYGGAGADTLDGGAGNDTLDGGPGHDLLEDMRGNNVLIGGGGNDTLRAGKGHDLLEGGQGNDRLFGGAGRDTLRGGNGNDHLEGGPGPDLLIGGNGNDRLLGGAGRDTLRGGAGNDTLRGGAGHDRLEGGAGNDVLFGDGGNDTLLGGAGHDRLAGGPGNDRLLGGAGRDTLQGGNGNDYLDGGAGPDLLVGGAGNDRLLGGGGNDTLRGGAGNDTLRGGAGRDRLEGGAGNDMLFGDGGNDTLIGGAGRDTMTGGPGADTFVWASAAQSRRAAPDLITDFQPGTDRLDLRALNLDYIGRGDFSDRGQLRWDHAGQRTHVLIDLNGDGQADMLIHLSGRLQLDADDFLL